jgi:hypothetical protein
LSDIHRPEGPFKVKVGGGRVGVEMPPPVYQGLFHTRVPPGHREYLEVESSVE